MYKTLKETWTQDKDYPDRTFRLAMLERVLDGTIYDQLKLAFHEEKSGNGEYVELRKRRPCVRYRLCRLVVNDAVSLLFSEGHFPSIDCEDEITKEGLEQIAKDVNLNEVFIDGAVRGSVGSIVIGLRVLKSRPFLSVMPTKFLTPVWNADAPDTLDRIEERYKVKGSDLKAAGYAIKEDELNVDFWFARDFTSVEETWYLPLKVSDKKEDKPFFRDAKKSVKHGLGFVPMVWIKNLPGGDDIDGDSTIPEEAIDTSIEVDYQLSQAGRGLKYSSDPTLLIKEPAFGSGTKKEGGASTAIVVDKDGDAKLLEIQGTAAQTVIEYVRFLREIAIESMHGNRANTEKQTAAPSGRALEMMNQSLIWLADKLRISYGEKGLLAILQMLVKAHAKVPFMTKEGEKVPPFASKALISLRWPKWYPPTPDDLQTEAITLTTLCDKGLLSRETAIKVLAEKYDIEDAKAEKALADADMKERNAAAQVKATITE